MLFIVAPPSLSAKAKLDMAQLRQMGGTSQYKFSVLSKIVRHMRHRHMEGEDQALTLDDILDETNQVKKWLNIGTSYGLFSAIYLVIENNVLVIYHFSWM